MNSEKFPKGPKYKKQQKQMRAIKNETTKVILYLSVSLTRKKIMIFPLAGGNDFIYLKPSPPAEPQETEKEGAERE